MPHLPAGHTRTPMNVVFITHRKCRVNRGKRSDSLEPVFTNKGPDGGSPSGSILLRKHRNKGAKRTSPGESSPNESLRHLDNVSHGIVSREHGSESMRKHHLVSGSVAWVSSVLPLRPPATFFPRGEKTRVVEEDQTVHRQSTCREDIGGNHPLGKGSSEPTNMSKRYARKGCIVDCEPRFPIRAFSKGFPRGRPPAFESGPQKGHGNEK